MEKHNNFIVTISLFPSMLFLSSGSLERKIARLVSPGGGGAAGMHRL
jgi:hypothetical protein